MIAETSWKHDDVGSLELLGALEVRFTLPVAIELRDPTPDCMEVHLEARNDEQFGTDGPWQVFAIPGVQSFVAASRVRFKSAVPQQALKKVAPQGGRVRIRVHCWRLFDKQGGLFSAAPDLIVGQATPRLPGGTFESWFRLG